MWPSLSLNLKDTHSQHGLSLLILALIWWSSVYQGSHLTVAASLFLGFPKKEVTRYSLQVSQEQLSPHFPGSRNKLFGMHLSSSFIHSFSFMCPFQVFIYTYRDLWLFFCFGYNPVQYFFYSVALTVPVWAVSGVLVGFCVVVMIASPLLLKPFFTFWQYLTGTLASFVYPLPSLSIRHFSKGLPFLLYGGASATLDTGWASCYRGFIASRPLSWQSKGVLVKPIIHLMLQSIPNLSWHIKT